MAYKNKLAREAYLENRNSMNGIDMIKKNHVKTKDIKADMKLFEERKDGKVIGTYYNRVEIRQGSKLIVINLLMYK